MIGTITAQWGRAFFFSVEGAAPWTESDARTFVADVERIAAAEEAKKEAGDGEG